MSFHHIILLLPLIMLAGCKSDYRPEDVERLKENIQSGNLSEAHRNIIELDKTKFRDSSEYAFLRARVYYKDKKMLLSAKWIEESIARGPEDEADEKYYLMAKIYLDLHQLEAASHAIKNAIKIDNKKSSYLKLQEEIESIEKKANVED